MNVDEFLGLEWSSPGSPLIEPPRFSPVIADPSFLFPEETPSGDWELFAHCAWGIHRYASKDGLSWRDRGIVARNAMRPFVRRYGSEYLLYYEKYAPFALPMTALPVRPRWSSTIAVSRSIDLARWSRPRTLVAPELPWMSDRVLGASVSNPCVVRDGEPDKNGGQWLMYFSASLSWIEDCGFCEPRYIAVARGKDPAGPFAVDPLPIIDPANDETPGALGAGSIKAIRLDDGWIGLQNKIYSDGNGNSRSAIFALVSDDGLSWRAARPEPLVAPGGGWTSSHVYACDCRFREADGRWYLYFNARDGWKLADGRERIGRITGRGRL